MKVDNVSLTVILTVRLEDLDSHSAPSAAVVGRELAIQVAEYARKHRLGYYPALEYFQESEREVDKELLGAADNLSWLATTRVREEVREHLRPVFSSLRFDAMQNLVYTMPRVRPGKPSSLLKLAEHFTPNRVRLELTAQIMNRNGEDRDLKRYSTHLVHRWLKEHFDNIEVTSCRQQG